MSGQKYLLSAMPLALCLAASVQAQTRSFEAAPIFLETDSAQVFEYDGLTFSATSFYGVQKSLPSTNNPGNYLVYYADSSSLSVRRSDGGAFSLNSFDFGPSENISGPGSLWLTGYVAGGGLVSTALSFGSPFSSIGVNAASLSGFSNLTQVVFGALDSGYGYVWLDNLAIAPVPEPTPAIMLMAGLGLLGSRLRRVRAIPA